MPVLQRGTLSAVDERFDELHEALGSSLVIRRAWLETWMEVFAPAQWQPWVLTLDRAAGLDGVAPLTRRRVAGCWQIRCMGGPEPERAPIVGRSPRAERRVAVALANELCDLRSPWSLFIPRLPTDSPIIDELTQRFQMTQVAPGGERATLVISDREPARYLSANTKKSVARHRNRIARSGLDLDLRWSDDPDAIVAALDDVIAVHRDRDHELGRVSSLDDPTGRRFYRSVIERHAGNAELLTLRLDGDLAAYALCLRDGARLLVLDNRMRPGAAPFAPGLLANAEVVRHAVLDPDIEVVDWGVGIQRYKRSSSNHTDTTTNLTVWSSPGLRRSLDTLHRMSGRRRGRGDEKRPTASRSTGMLRGADGAA